MFSPSCHLAFFSCFLLLFHLAFLQCYLQSLCSMVSSNIFFCLIWELKGCHCSESCSSAILISKMIDSAVFKKTMRSKPHRLGNKNGFIFGTYSVCCRFVNFKYEALLLLLINCTLKSPLSKIPTN